MNCNNVMLRNHYVVTVHIETPFRILIGVYYSLFIIADAIFFTILLAIQIKIRKGCHPFFSVLFTCILFCYICSDLMDLFCQLFFLAGAHADTMNTLHMIYDQAYATLTPLCVCCLIERTIATVWAVSYETNRKWVLYTLSVTFFIAAYMYAANYVQFARIYMSGIMTAIITLGCIGLYVLNRKWTICYQTDISLMSKITLSLRYQIIENMVVVRKALLPVIVLDSLVTLIDLFSIKLNDVIIKENTTVTCHSLVIFSPYVVLNHVAMLLEFCIPLYMLLARKVYYRPFYTEYSILNSWGLPNELMWDRIPSLYPVASRVQSVLLSITPHSSRLSTRRYIFELFEILFRASSTDELVLHAVVWLVTP
uniref:G protein-coupled receptor n=1 Tax=Caenorhabditis japonica TaxID=281687 RepID=A0A8R1HGP2_CAEJA